MLSNAGLIGSKVAIVGGGILGMRLAWKLRESGAKVTVFEAAPKTGGLASPTSIGGYVWDRFYHVILLSDQYLMRMLEELGLDGSLRWGVTKTGFYSGGKLVSMSNAVEFLKFPPLSIFEKMRLGSTIFLASRIKDWRSLEKLTAIEWLEKYSGRSVLEKVWRPLLKCKLGDNSGIASAAFIWAIIARMYAARRAGLKQEMFGYVEGGYAVILSALQDRLDQVGVNTLNARRVTSVTSSGTGVRLSTDADESMEFDHAVLTVPTRAIASICPGLTQSEKDRLHGVTYQGIVCPSLLLSRPLSSYYVTNITDSGIPFTGVIEMTALVDKSAFDGNSLVYFPYYLTQNSGRWNDTDQQFYEECESTLERMYPSFRRDQVVARNIARARDVLAVSTLNYSEELLPPVTTSVPNVYVLNSAQIANGTLNVNETLGVVEKNFDKLVGAMCNRLRDAA